LQAMTRKFLTPSDFGYQGDSPQSDLGENFGDLISQRMALGDVEQAFYDYKAFFELPNKVRIQTHWKLLRPAWEHPSNTKLQTFVKEQVSKLGKIEAKEKSLKPGQAGIFMSVLLDRTHWTSPAVRELIVELLEDERVFG